MKWKEIASAQLAGQIDRVLSKVVQCYGPEGRVHAEKQTKVADLVVGAELGKMMDLIHLRPGRTRREGKRKGNLADYGEICATEIRRGRLTSRRTSRKTDLL